MKRTVVLVLAFLALGAGTAHADEPAPITISPDQVRKICEERLPRVEDRVGKLTARINGGPEVWGSTANLRKRAAEASDPGRAQRLEERAARRAGHLDKLSRVQERIDTFQAKHCSYQGTK